MGAGASSSPWLDEKALRGAAMRGDAQEVKQLVLDCSVPPDATQPSDGRTPLIFACLKGNAEVCRLLVAELGASVNLSDFYGVTPLMCASSNGHESLVELLAAELDADVNADARLGQQQALLLARERGHDPVDNPAKKARSTLDDETRESPKVTSSSQPIVPGVASSVPASAVPASSSAAAEGEGLAVDDGNNLDVGVGVERWLRIGTEGGATTALTAAASSGHLECVELLLRLGADPLGGTTASKAAAAAVATADDSASLVVTEEATSATAGAAAEAAAATEMTTTTTTTTAAAAPASAAAVAVAPALTRNPSSLALIPPSSSSTASTAAAPPPAAVASASVACGSSACVLAAFKGHAAIVELLIGAEPKLADWPNAHGFTPCLAAALYNHGEVVRVLAQHGADLDVRLPTSAASASAYAYAAVSTASVSSSASAASVSLNSGGGNGGHSRNAGAAATVGVNGMVASATASVTTNSGTTNIAMRANNSSSAHVYDGDDALALATTVRNFFRPPSLQRLGSSSRGSSRRYHRSSSSNSNSSDTTTSSSSSSSSSAAPSSTSANTVGSIIVEEDDNKDPTSSSSYSLKKQIVKENKTVVMTGEVAAPAPAAAAEVTKIPPLELAVAILQDVRHAKVFVMNMKPTTTTAAAAAADATGTRLKPAPFSSSPSSSSSSSSSSCSSECACGGGVMGGAVSPSDLVSGVCSQQHESKISTAGGGRSGGLELAAGAGRSTLRVVVGVANALPGSSWKKSSHTSSSSSSSLSSSSSKAPSPSSSISSISSLITRLIAGDFFPLAPAVQWVKFVGRGEDNSLHRISQSSQYHHHHHHQQQQQLRSWTRSCFMDQVACDVALFLTPAASSSSSSSEPAAATATTTLSVPRAATEVPTQRRAPERKSLLRKMIAHDGQEDLRTLIASFLIFPHTETRRRIQEIDLVFRSRGPFRVGPPVQLPVPK